MSSSRKPRSSSRSRPAFFGAALVVLALHADAAPTGTKTSCSSGEAQQGVVTGIDERLDLTLADGTVLKLAGVEPPGPTPSDPRLDLRTRDKLSAWLRGRKVSFRSLAKRPDRWGRMPSWVRSEGKGPGAPTLSVTVAVLDAGLGRFLPGEAVRPCRTELRAAEAAARRDKLGIWADPYYSVIAASDREALREHTGTRVLVEGKVQGLDAGRAWTRLLLGPFSVTILQRDTKIFQEVGLDIERLPGKTLRIRGLLDTRFGPRIEVSSPDEIEVLPDGPPRSDAP